MSCQNCGYQNSPHAVTCLKCGHRLTPVNGDVNQQSRVQRRRQQ
ncbi:zinc-ribbon domain-containing protein [Lactiplantibacillus plantarum]|nr:zinc-ribbon domain-containing protein [Lactiplantibacillus plantarum]